MHVRGSRRVSFLTSMRLPSCGGLGANWRYSDAVGRSSIAATAWLLCRPLLLDMDDCKHLRLQLQDDLSAVRPLDRSSPGPYGLRISLALGGWGRPIDVPAIRGR
jgi:hypothetical protein